MRTCKAESCSVEFEPSTHNHYYHSIECKREQRRIRERDMTSDIAAAVRTAYLADSDDEDEDDIDTSEFLRKENRRLTNLVTKHKSHKSELVDAFYDAVFAAVSKLDIKPVSPPKHNINRSGDEEIANPALSDWQLGKKTRSYNIDVCRDRIELYGDKIDLITDIQRADHPVNDAHIHVLGDIVEGEDIFPGQAFEIDASLYQQIISGVEIMTDFVRRMLSIYETVKLTAVIGNHGRVGRRGTYNPETNMDRLLYKFVSMLFADEPRITFDIPDGAGESNFYAVDYMGDYGVLLMHGDQLPQPTSMHGYFKKVLGWKDTGIPEHFDDVIIGHWHQNTKATFGTTVLRIAGTPESDNSYAQERIGVMGRPSQHLQFVHPRRGVTGEYDIYLDD